MPEGYDDFEVAVLSGGGGGLDDAAGSGHVVLFSGDSLSADPGQLGVVVVAVEVV